MLPSSHKQGIATPEDAAITIRFATTGDARALGTLAQLDSARVPPSPVLMAEVAGQARAAISLRDGSAIADPFHRTEAILAFLVARAEHVRTDHPTRARQVRRVLTRAIARAQ